MSLTPSPAESSFKGIALFTPGHDVVYCLEGDKQRRWHLDLCTKLQELMGLAEPPHFLIPCYTATVDRWLDAQTKQVRTWAEAYPLVHSHQALLNALFGIQEVWQVKPLQPDQCDPLVLSSFRHQYPQLWETQDLIVRHRTPEKPKVSSPTLETPLLTNSKEYVFRFFVADHSRRTERNLKTLYECLENSLPCSYTLRVIDIHQHPEEAETNQVTATPTLMKVWPPPARRIVGDLNRLEQVLQILS